MLGSRALILKTIHQIWIRYWVLSVICAYDTKDDIFILMARNKIKKNFSPNVLYFCNWAKLKVDLLKAISHRGIVGNKGSMNVKFKVASGRAHTSEQRGVWLEYLQGLSFFLFYIYPLNNVLLNKSRVEVQPYWFFLIKWMFSLRRNRLSNKHKIIKKAQ